MEDEPDTKEETEELQGKKEALIDYVKKFEEISITNKKLNEIKDRFLCRMEGLKMPLLSVLERVDTSYKEITIHWMAEGANYSEIPVLHSGVPKFQEAFRDYMSLTVSQLSFLVDALLEIIKEADDVVVEKEGKEKIEKKIIELLKKMKKSKELLIKKDAAFEIRRLCKDKPSRTKLANQHSNKIIGRDIIKEEDEMR